MLVVDYSKNIKKSFIFVVMKTQNIKDLKVTSKQLQRNLAKALEKTKKYSDENKILRKVEVDINKESRGLLLRREKTRDKSRLNSTKMKNLENKLKSKRPHFTGLTMQLAVMLHVFINSFFQN